MNIRLPELHFPAVNTAQLALKVGSASTLPAVIFVSNGGR